MSDNCFMDEKLPFAEAMNANIDFLLSDLDVAMTFLDVASITTVEENAQRSRQKAYKAYDFVINRLSKIKLNVSYQHQFDKKLTALNSTLSNYSK
jgi:hypothetical protein